MARWDDDARRWARPDPSAASDGRDRETTADDANRSTAHSGNAQSPGRDEAPSPASPWTRGLQPPRRPTDASPPSELQPPELPWVAPDGPEASAMREKSMVPLAIGVALLAVLACVPHWVAPTIALIVSLVGVPIAWGFRRISYGRRRVQYIVVVLTLLLIATLSVLAPMTWLQLGVLQPLTVPD